MSGVGTLGSGHVDFIEGALSSRKNDWTFCAWHKTQRLLQIGSKNDEVGYAPYDACRRKGAFIANGHEHSYSRTHLMSDFAQQTIAEKSSVLRLDYGKTYSFISGLGGFERREWDADLKDNPWWAAVGARNNNVDYGALFCTFPIGSVDERAKCYFKDVSGKIIDEFEIDNSLIRLEKEQKAIHLNAKDTIKYFHSTKVNWS